MKIKIGLLLILPLLSIVLLTSCEPLNEAKFVVDNRAAESIYLNFRGDLYPVQPGETKTFSSLPAGEYPYETIFALPAGVTDFTSEGAVTGSVKILGGTQCRLVYTSTFVEGSYTIYGSYSTSDDASRPIPWEKGPLFP